MVLAFFVRICMYCVSRFSPELLKMNRAIVDMPDRLIDLFINLCVGNNGRLPKNKRKAKFEKLTDKEVSQMEGCVRNAFNQTVPEVN